MAKLISYLPDVLREVYDFGQICAAGDREIADLLTAFSDYAADCFVDTLTERGCGRWERMMKISPKATDDLAVRRFRILSKLNEELPYTFRGLLRQLSVLCGEGGYSAEVDYGNYSLKVLVALTASKQFEEVQRLLERVVPANMTIMLSLKYNQHKVLAGRTHGQLAAYTHNQLRNEVMT